MARSGDSTEREIADLLARWSAIMRELRELSVLRSGNVPTGDYAEYLVARYFDVVLESGSRKGYDLIAHGKRIQVKARRVTRTSKPSHFSVIRDIREDQADELIAVLFDEDFRVTDAWVIPWPVVRELSKKVPRLNGHRLMISAIRDDRRVTPLSLG